MGGAIPHSHHHIRLRPATINITHLILQSVPRFLRLRADVGPTPLPPFDRSNCFLCIQASEKSTRGISLVDRKCLPTQKLSDLRF
jgi:hypothetical protein